MRATRSLWIIPILLVLFSGTSTFAVWSTNTWTTDGVSYSGDNNDAAHWDPAAPGTTDIVMFTNQQGSAYTVTFQQNTTNGVLDVGTDNVIFDMNGYFWRLEADAAAPGVWVGGYTNLTSQSIAADAGEVATVTFSSSSAGTNTITMNGHTRNSWFGNATGSATLNINSNLGYGAKFWLPNGGWNKGLVQTTINVDGTGAEFRDDANYGGVTRSTLNVTDGGLVDNRLGNNLQFWSGGGGNTVNVSQAGTLLTGRIQISYFSPGGLWNITDGGTWNGGDVNVAHLTVYPNHPVINYDGELLIDGSATAATLRSLRIGDYNGGSYPANAQAHVQNGATLTVTNHLSVGGGSAGSSYTNRLVLNNATINLGGGATAGVLTNSGYMKAMGTITGLGASPALVYSGPSGPGTGAFFEVGGSIGTLVLNNANLELAAGSVTLWEFSDTSLDQIILNGGSASVLGSNVFSLASGSATPVPGVPWGLRAYDFVVGDNVTWNPQYDDLTNVLAGYGLVQNLDYRFGVVGLDGGLQALRLEFVPEPSTVLLLIGGGLLVWRSRRRR